MSKKCMIRREVKRKHLFDKHKEVRQKLRKIVNSLETSLEEKHMAQHQFKKLTRDSSIVRRTRRCAITGRARGNYRFFGISRAKIRELIEDFPGVTKSSW